MTERDPLLSNPTCTESIAIGIVNVYTSIVSSISMSAERAKFKRQCEQIAKLESGKFPLYTRIIAGKEYVLTSVMYTTNNQTFDITKMICAFLNVCDASLITLRKFLESRQIITPDPCDMRNSFIHFTFSSDVMAHCAYNVNRRWSFLERRNQDTMFGEFAIMKCNVEFDFSEPPAKQFIDDL